MSFGTSSSQPVPPPLLGVAADLPVVPRGGGSQRACTRIAQLEQSKATLCLILVLIELFVLNS